METFPLQPITVHRWEADLATWATKLILQPVRVLMAAPVFLFFAALTAMLLRPPDVQFFEIDRIVFALLFLGVLAGAVVRRQQIFVFERASLPMIGLSGLAVLSAAGQPFDNETWSLLASKFVVSFVLFHLAILVFTQEKRLRQFEIFTIVVLGYLTFTAVAFLGGAHSLIFPSFILNEDLGFHAARARGPLLQAVANGVSLNILGLLAVHAYQRKRIQGLGIVLLIASVPIAIVATMTRTVWLSFAGSIVALAFVSKKRQLRRATYWVLAVVVLGLAGALSPGDLSSTIRERLEESGPVEYRAAVYAGGWEMFLQRPLLGWGIHNMPAELPRHVNGYRGKTLYPHNTYLELMVEHGVVGIVLYLWLMCEIWRLGRRTVPKAESNGFLNPSFHRFWPIILGVYWVNAALVVMSYQFVNGLLFTLAGMLAAQRRRAELAQPC
jgi:O-antigen ligase